MTLPHIHRLHGKPQQYSGIFAPDSGDVELDGEIVSSTEMTGAVPAARKDPDDPDAIEAYVF